MTEFDLLKYIGEADDAYIMDSRRRPQKRKPRWPYALAACLLLAVLAGGGTALFQLRNTGTAEKSASDQEELLQVSTEETAEPSSQGAVPEEAETTETGETYGVNLLAAAEYPEAVGAEDYEAASAQWQENQVTEETKTALNTFAYSTAAALLRDQEESGCYSPLSLYQTLAILAYGAQGQTRDELLSLLGQSDVETLASEAGKLYRVNYFDNEVNKLRIANSLWLDETMGDGTEITYNQEWVLSVAANYYASVYGAEFSQEDTALALGQWIADNTGDMIHPTPETLNFDPNTVMAIVNTLWYKTPWAEPFEESETETGDFTTETGVTVETKFMHRTDMSGSYIQTEEYTKSYLQLNQGKMILVLPQEGVDIDSLLTEEKLWEIFENGDYESGQVVWSVPKFETSTTYADLADTLQSLGVTSAFQLGVADFSLISEDAPLYVGQIQQGTHIVIDEEGVEAAAYSLASMEAGEGEPEELPTIEMNLNRPFLYLITANDGSTLFLGVVRNPTE